MFNAYCLDKNGDPVYNLTQWDYNQQLIVDCEDYNIISAPAVHFCNANSTEAYSVQSTMSDGVIKADIPNVLLTEALKIIAYLFVIDDDSGKTVYTIEIPVRKRVKPSDYEYTENIEVVTLSQLISQVQTLNDTVNSNETIRINQEKLRQENTAQAITNAQNATTAATTATKECEDVTAQAKKALSNQAQLEETLNTATQIKQDVSQMQTAVAADKEQVAQDKADIEDTIKNSLLASSEEILASVKSYYERAEALYNSLYLDCDGETPSLRAVTPLFIDGATPAVRNSDVGIDYDGGTPTSRTVAA